uniref:Defensin n=1 Tax=Plantago major TaxID=29818 RepID=Q5ZFP2_PLAMJ|nr:defensin [Plantago major]
MGRFWSVLFALFLVLVITGPMVGEARKCRSASHRFKGTCLSDTNCASVCKTEGFPGGDCKGLRRRCFCETHC